MGKPNHLRIIVIDDNSGIHQDFNKILAKEQVNEGLGQLDKLLFGGESPIIDSAQLPTFEIDNAYQGQDGLKLIEEALKENNPYSLAFVDVQMPPGWDGIETIKRIWALDKYIQIVICTAYSDYTWEETVEELGISDSLLILKKPFDSIAVRQLACALTKKWQLMQQAAIHTDYLENTVKERTNSLQRSLSLTRATLESSYNGIVVVNTEGQLVDCNRHFIDMWAIDPSLIESKNYDQIQEQMIVSLINPDTFLELIQHYHDLPEESNTITLKLKNNRFFECYSQPHVLENIPVGRVWSFRDITPRVELENRLQHQATHDTLTSLPNRALLIERIEQGIANAKRQNKLFAVTFIDLDRFKLINDSFSHKAGDELLVAISKGLKEITRGEDTIARLSGDEFIALSSSINKSEDAMIVVSKILQQISKPVKVADRYITVTASLGVSIYPQDGDNPETLLRNADLAMYRAKGFGGNQIQFYKAELNEQSLVRFEKETELRQALAKNEFYLEYQPQYDVKNKKIIAVEALIRWKHPTKGIVLPLEFIPLAEETNLIIPIGEWVLRAACQHTKACQDKGLPPFRVAVNVAAKQFMQPNLVEVIQNILTETGLEAKFLEIEVTENVIISNVNVTDTIRRLKQLGINIVLDDFGTGNSGLHYLRDLPIDRLKIDRTFIENIDSNRSDEVIIRAIIAMADSLYLDVLAEGVETENQLNFLEQEHCKKFQGFFFSKPISASSLEQLLKDN